MSEQTRSLAQDARGRFELVPVEKLARHFGVSLAEAKAAQDDLGYMYRELASMPTQCDAARPISDDALFNIATEAWSIQTDASWSSDGLEAAILAVREAVESSAIRTPAAWECQGRKQALPEPADCNWPDCGCDPHATKVIESLLEQGWCDGTVTRQQYQKEIAQLRAQVETANARLRQLKDSIDTRINDLLCETKPGYDDSVVGINDAWDVVRKACDLYIAMSHSSTMREGE